MAYLDYPNPCRFIAGLSMASGLLILFGWMMDIKLLKSLIPGLFPVTFPTALGLVVGGYLLYLSIQFYKTEKWEMTQFGAALSSILLTLLVIPFLATQFFHVENGLEDIVGQHVMNGIAVPNSVPSVGGLVCVLFLTLIAYGLFFRLSFVQRYITFLGLFLFVVAGIALMGHVAGDPSLYYTSSTSRGMQLQTATLYCLLGIGFMSAQLRAPIPFRHPREASG